MITTIFQQFENIEKSLSSHYLFESYKSIQFIICNLGVPHAATYKHWNASI